MSAPRSRSRGNVAKAGAQREPVFVVDEDVPDEVVTALRNAGHRVLDVKRELARGASDPEIAEMAASAGGTRGVVVTGNVRDFKRLLDRSRPGGPGSLLLDGVQQEKPRQRIDDLAHVLDLECRHHYEDDRIFITIRRVNITLHR